MTLWNSRSVISTLASPCFSMKAMASASRRTFKVLSTAPVMGTPKCASSMAGVLGSITATVSPRPMPRPTKALARRRQRW
ncbi:hypothetical protein D3C81_1585330 [compost metagenome]